MFGTVEKQRYVFVPKAAPKPLPVILARFFVKAAGFALAVIVRAVWWAVQQSTIGRHRAKIAPLWVGLIACIPWSYAWWASASLLWQFAAGCAVVAAWLPVRFGYEPRWLSVRERWILSSGWSCAGIWHLTSGILPWQWWAAGWVVIVIGHSIPWWIGRRVRPVVDARHELEIEWAEKITDHPDAGCLAGSVLTYDQPSDRFHLHVPPGRKPDEVAKADDLAASLLGLHRGGITIGVDPDRTINDFLVALADRGGAAVFRHWDGDPMDPDGSFEAIETDSGDSVRLNLRRPGVGATFLAAIAPTGGGKGSMLRLAGIVAAKDPLTFQIGVCGKEGAGIPYLAAGCRMFASTPEEWQWVLEGVLDLMVVRKRRQKEQGRDGWWATPEEPQIWLTIDELPEVVAGGGSKAVGKACAAAIARISQVGRSLGVSGIVATQKGAEPQWGATMTRGNWMKGGQSVLYRAEDIQMINSANQSYQLNLAGLPKAPGWVWTVSGIDDRPPVRGRVLWIPHRYDVVSKGHAAPHGTVEDHLRWTVHPELLQEEAAALRLAQWDARDVDGGDGGVVERPSLTVVQSSRSDARARVLAAVPEPPSVARKGEIAEAAGVSPDVAKWHLRILSDGDGPVVRVGEGNDTAYQRRTA